MRRSIVASLVAVAFVLVLMLPLVAVAQTNKMTGTTGATAGKTTSKTTGMTGKPAAKKMAAKHPKGCKCPKHKRVAAKKTAAMGKGPCRVHGKKMHRRMTTSMRRAGCTCPSMHRAKKSMKARRMTRPATMGRGPCRVHGKKMYRRTTTSMRRAGCTCPSKKRYTRARGAAYGAGAKRCPTGYTSKGFGYGARGKSMKKPSTMKKPSATKKTSTGSSY